MNPSPNRNKVRQIVAPGIWIDEDGHSHWSIVDLMDHIKLEDTPENREAVKEVLRDIITLNNPNAKFIERSTPEE